MSRRFKRILSILLCLLLCVSLLPAAAFAEGDDAAAGEISDTQPVDGSAADGAPAAPADDESAADGAPADDESAADGAPADDEPAADGVPADGESAPTDDEPAADGAPADDESAADDADAAEDGEPELLTGTIENEPVTAEPANTRTVTASGECGAQGGNLTWTLYSDGELVISGTGAMADYSWGSAPWHDYTNQISTAELENGVTSAGKYAFCSCSSLTSVTIPSTVTAIGDGAFTNCGALMAMTIPSSVATIGAGAFEYCSNLAALTISDGVTSIGIRAFQYCVSLTSVVIPASVTELGIGVFENCGSISSISVSQDNTVYSSVDGVLMSKDGTRLIEYPAAHGSTYTIPTGVTCIESCAFMGNRNLTSLTIPESVAEIGSSAFSGCFALTNLTLPTSMTRIGDSAFSSCGSLTSINLPTGLACINNSVFNNCAALASVTIPAGVTEIGYSAFNGCESLAAVTIPEGVTGIGWCAFSACSSLASVTIPASVTSIADSAFGGCSALTDLFYGGRERQWNAIDIGLYNEPLNNATKHFAPEPVAVVSGECGAQGGNLAWTLYSDGELVISGTGAMADYTGQDRSPWSDYISSLTTAVIESGVTSIGNCAFLQCGYLTDVTIPSSVARIGDSAFFRCGNLTSVAIPNGVTSIEANCFQYCSSLASVTIPSSVTSIGQAAFQGCTNLAGVTIPAGVTSISMDCFCNCAALTSVTISANATEILSGAFQGCTNLASIAIPASVTSIGNYAFISCDSLSDVYYGGTEQQWAAVTVGTNNAALTSATIHYDSAGLPRTVTASGVDGEQGDNLCWTLYSDGELVISGTGRMAERYAPEHAPWYGYRSDILSAVIENGVTNIGVYAFDGCSDLQSVSIADSVTDLWGYAFFGCSSLAQITLPAGLDSIGTGAFLGCSSLTSITIPAGVTSIGDDVFGNCSSLASIAVDPANEAFCTYDGVLFSADMTRLICYPAQRSGSSYTVPASVTEISGFAFGCCSGLTSITLSAGITAIDSSTFQGCTNLTSLAIPAGVTRIGFYAFSDCACLSHLTIPASVESVYGRAFEGCSGLVTAGPVGSGANIEYAWTDTIPTQAFNWADSLQRVLIPASVTEISESAFWGCSALTDVYYGGTEQQWAAVTVGTDNDALSSATMHYNASIEPEPQTLTVTFHAYGGSFSTEESVETTTLTITSGDILSSVCSYELRPRYSDGRIFDYWSRDAAGLERVDNLYGTPVTEDMTVYAQPTADTVTINWITWNGSSLMTQTVKRGSYILSAPGHAWYYDSACTRYFDVFSHRFDEDVTVYLQPQSGSDSVSITFDCNGGTFACYGSPTEQSVITLAVGQPPVAEVYSAGLMGDFYETHCYHKDGFSIVGWTLTRDGTDELDFYRGFTEDTTVYAKWTPAAAVRLDGNGKIFAASSAAEIDLNVPLGTAIAAYIDRYASSDWPERSSSLSDESGSFVVEGWYYDAACTRPLSPDDLASDVTLFAKWAEPYEICFDANGGFMDSELTWLVVPGESINLNSSVNIRRSDDRFICVGWSTQRSGGVLIPDLSQYVPQRSETLYAQWAEGAELTFWSDRPFSTGDKIYKMTVLNGETVGSVNLDEGCAAFIEEWYYDIDCTRSAGDLNALYLDGDATLYAEWSAPRTVTASGSCGAQGGNVTWTLYDDGGLVISGSGAMADGTAENTYPWSGYTDSITSAVIQRGVTSVGNWAFYCCDRITSVTIPSSVTRIGDGAFYGISSLTSIAIPASVTGIGYGAFRACRSLTSIAIPAGVTSIGQCVFDGCSALTSVTIPASVTEISRSAFWGCSALSDVYYGGTEQQWTAITVGEGNDALASATIHYNSDGPCTVTLNANGGYFAGTARPTEKTYSIEPGEALGFSRIVLHENPDLALAGWCLDAACTGETYELASFVPQGNTTLYAKWVSAPRLVLTIYGESYGYCEVVVTDAEVLNADGTTSGIVDEDNSYLIVQLMDAEGERVPGFLAQGERGLAAHCDFPMGDTDMTAGTYKLLAYKQMGSVMLTAEKDFYYTGYEELHQDLENFTLSLTLSTDTLADNEVLNQTAEVIDTMGNPADRVKVVFETLFENGDELPDGFGIYNITHAGGTCSLGVSYTEDAITPAGRYKVVAWLADCPEIRDEQYFTFVGKGRNLSFASHSLLLSGELGVNFYMDLSELTAAEKAASYMSFTVNGVEQTDVFDASHTNPGGDGWYGFTCLINAAQMADEITAVFHYGDGGAIRQVYRASDYVEYVSQNPNAYSAQARALVAALGSYGANVQPFLAWTNGWIEGEQHASMSGGESFTADDLNTIRGAAANYAVGKDLGTSRVAKVTYSLDLQSKTDLNVYFRLRSGYAGPVTATLDGAAVNAVHMPDGRWRVTVPSIAAHALGTMHSIVLTADGDCTVTVSALSYVYAALSSSSEVFANDTARAAVASLYRYYEAASSYLAALGA